MISCIIGELINRKPLFPGKDYVNQVELILSLRGFQDRSDLGFEVNAETLSFLERKNRFPGRSLSSAIPNATPDALDLLEHLLDLNPTRRPSAISALEFTYLQDADIICDYTNVSQPAPLDENYFAFEKNPFTLDVLRQMIADEVATMQSL